ncbi:uncharacterized protein TNCV_1321731 [Trichonephila clavipes]|nr:uncharacterized protein TNCV_1321731 [Trichonephila clavipes]
MDENHTTKKSSIPNQRAHEERGKLNLRWIDGLEKNLIGPGSNPGEDMNVCKCIVILRHGGTLNSGRAASSLLWLVEGEERWEAPGHSQSFLLQNWGGDFIIEQTVFISCNGSFRGVASAVSMIRDPQHM